MRYLRILFTCLLVPVFMAGCATSNSSMGNIPCAIIGAVAGGAAGGAASSDVGGALLGAAGGAVMSQLFCGQDDGLDSDGDWVPDEFDQCPGTEEGLAVDGQGCPLDSDGDGVPDHKDKCYREYGKGPDGCPLDSDGDGVDDSKDKCPNTPAGVKVNEMGCPSDADGDGVPDEWDQCPGTPAGVPVNAAGCSKLFIENIHFDFDSAKIKPIAKAALDSRVVPALRANSGLKAKIVGHTDSTGPAQYNEGLSLRRAQSVRDYLVSQGISITRLSVAGRGESEPVASNATRAGRADNRRVEFVVK